MLKNYLCKNDNSKTRVITLFCDIETFQYNEKAGRKRPSLYKNKVFSVAVSYWDGDVLEVDHSYTDFKQFFLDIDKSINTKTRVKLVFHNGNSYDNHYLLNELVNYFHVKRHPMYLRNAVNNEGKVRLKDLGLNTVLESRVKQATSVALKFQLNNPKIIYQTEDSLPKTGFRSIESLGESLQKAGCLAEDELKTDFNYLKYNQDDDLTWQESVNKAQLIHQTLTPDQFKYIDNDVIILAHVVHDFGVIFTGFDYSKITFSQNIMGEYDHNPLAHWQLKHQYQKQHVKYSDFDFNHENLFDYLKHYYKGGLNFYNDKYLGKIIKRKISSYDRNSSYPSEMWNEKLPTYLIDAKSGNHTYQVRQDTFDLIEVDADEFNRLLDFIPSVLIRKMLVKYYSSLNDNFYLTNKTIELMNYFTPTPIKVVNVVNELNFATEYFGARDTLQANYTIKQQGKNDYKLDTSDLSDIKVLDTLNTNKNTPEEVVTSKVILNGIYGLPALRAYFNLFVYDDVSSDYINEVNGFANTERNQVFSLAVTSLAFRDLLEPLRDVPAKLIDKYVYYGDTDSIYCDDAIDKYVDKSQFDQNNIGYFKTEHHIDQMLILNHKKYAYHDYDKGKNFVLAGGVTEGTFDLDVPFNEFVEQQFHAGVHLASTKNILTKNGTIAIYPADLKLEIGKPYLAKVNPFAKIMLAAIAEEVHNEVTEAQNQEENSSLLFVETPFGSLSQSEIYPTVKPLNERDVSTLIFWEKKIMGELNQDASNH